MPSLHIRELPENIYRLLRERARKEGRSLAREAIVTLARGLNAPLSPKGRRAELLERIAAARFGSPAHGPDPVALVREDRDR